MARLPLQGPPAALGPKTIGDSLSTYSPGCKFTGGLKGLVVTGAD